MRTRIELFQQIREHATFQEGQVLCKLLWLQYRTVTEQRWCTFHCLQLLPVRSLCHPSLALSCALTYFLTACSLSLSLSLSYPLSPSLHARQWLSCINSMMGVFMLSIIDVVLLPVRDLCHPLSCSLSCWHTFSLLACSLSLSLSLSVHVKDCHVSSLWRVWSCHLSLMLALTGM